MFAWMKHCIEKFIVRLWNRTASRREKSETHRGLDLGAQMAESELTRSRIAIPHSRRAEHVMILGKTGSGKSSLVRHLEEQDLVAERGGVFIGLHGDTKPFILGTIAARERITGQDLSEKLIVIEPGDSEYSVGLNPLENESGTNRFVQVAEFAQTLKERWHLESFGARTDELLRNALFALAEAKLTIIELAPFLSNAAFRASCLQHVRNAEIRQYFDLRYDQVTEPMRRVMAEPVLNKTASLVADPHFRHILGQQRSSFSVREAMDRGFWIILDLHKGRLGEQSATLGSLFITTIKQALFSRGSRDLFTIYADEVQNLISMSGSELETMLSESRKFGISIVTSNQILDQLPAEVRAAMLGTGTQIFFQLSSSDAQQIATALDGGKPLGELLKNLPQRHMVVKTGHDRWHEAVVPQVNEPKVDYSDLYNRCRKRWARKREDIEKEIMSRQSEIGRSAKEALHEWE
jgi:energy-coupling factor transporter ATP-binding protein EcfA2